MKDCLEAAKALGISPKQATICGGGARMAQWRQLCADILEIPVVQPVVEEGPAYGAAMLSMVACGAFDSVKEAADKLVRFRDPIPPNSELSGYYSDKYQRWRRLYPTLKPLFHHA